MSQLENTNSADLHPRFLSLLHRSSNTPVTATVLHSVITVLMICVTTRHHADSHTLTTHNIMCLS